MEDGILRMAVQGLTRPAIALSRDPSWTFSAGFYESSVDASFICFPLVWLFLLLSQHNARAVCSLRWLTLGRHHQTTATCRPLTSRRQHVYLVRII